ncbi:MAG: HPF/RaiA family ribosome-associated protein [Candidatus Dormibacteria bacterium]
MSATVTARRPLAAPMISYAERKLQRLERHANLHDVSLLIDHDENRIPCCAAEVIVHIHHTRLAVKAEGKTIQEAIDRVIDKADRQVLRRKERVGQHRGHDDGHAAAEAEA